MLKHYKQFRPFTEAEAWTLFKLAAIAEAVGWSLLITGIALRDYVMHGNNDPVTIAGQIHGMLFLSYIAAVLVCSPSLGWSLPRTIVAGLCSVPPYGSLVYEWLSSRHRNFIRLQTLQRLTGYTILNARNS